MNGQLENTDKSEFIIKYSNAEQVIFQTGGNPVSGGINVAAGFGRLIAQRQNGFDKFQLWEFCGAQAEAARNGDCTPLNNG